ncbi:MAG: hypothetical protein M1376_24575 [Planctomycetes bacterium]|nr:hypothetical protein [Planctomycetota bacterium]
MHAVGHRFILFGFAFLLLNSPLAAKDSAGGTVGRKDAGETEGRFTQNGFLKIDGAPRLILGLYELPRDDGKLAEIAAHGFNLVRVPQDSSALDRVHKQGLYAWICLGSAVQLNPNDARSEQRLAETINTFQEHPALLVWELPDEALWNIWWSRFPWIFGGQQNDLGKRLDAARADTPEATIAEGRSRLNRANDYTERGLWKQAEELYDGLWTELKADNPHPTWKMSRCAAESDSLIDATVRGCRVVRQRDGRHILWQNHAPRNSVAGLRKYKQMVDAAGCDIYPAPANYGVGHSDLKDMNLSSVGAYTDRMRAAAPGKAVWMVLQGFGWRDLSKEGKNEPDANKGRRPRLAETRFMAYDALVHGANAILYWGTDYIEKDSALWKDLMKTARELRALEPALVGGPVEGTPAAAADETYGSIDGQGPRLMLRRAGNHWVLIAVNEYPQGISFQVKQLPKEMEGRTLYRLYSEETQVVTNESFRDGIRGLGVHVYATSREFESR